MMRELCTNPIVARLKRNLSMATIGIRACQKVGVVGMVYNHKMLPMACAIKLMLNDALKRLYLFFFIKLKMMGMNQ